MTTGAQTHIFQDPSPVFCPKNNVAGSSTDGEGRALFGSRSCEHQIDVRVKGTPKCTALASLYLKKHVLSYSAAILLENLTLAGFQAYFGPQMSQPKSKGC